MMAFVPALASVIIPVHNGARFLGDALASVAAQQLDLEVIVVDDGSTDDSAQIAEALGATCIRQPNLGPSAARNAGIVASTAPTLMFLDADDLFMPDTAARQLAHLDARPEVDGVIGLQEYLVLDDVALPEWAVRDRVGQPDQTSRPSVLASAIRRAAFDRVGLFDTELLLSEDVDWLMRANEAGVVIDVVHEPVIVRRIHGANLTYDTVGLRRAMFEVLSARVARKRGGP